MSAPPQARPTPDHLALVQALLEAGQLGRALELLDAVWHHDLHDEHCWYLRLWIVAAQGRVLEALELARSAATQLPGSAAIAYLRAGLEHRAGHPEAAIEAALRAAAIAPGRPEPEALLEQVLAEKLPMAEPGPSVAPARSGVDTPINLVAVALAGLALLHPAGSLLAFRPAMPAAEPPVASGHHEARDRRRLWLIAAATIAAAVWAARDPLLASAALAAAVAWLSRPGRSSDR